MRTRFSDLAVHLARLAMYVGFVGVAARTSSTPVMVVAAVLLFLEAFALTHDLMHGALLLPRAVNDVALALAGSLLLMSGHALRRTHLTHHARPLAEDDIEGRPANGGLFAALANGPRASVELRVHAFVSSRVRGRRWQGIETAGNVVAGVAMVASGCAPLVVYVLVAICLQVTMGVWAAHIPHNAPAWLTGIAARMTWTGSPTMLSLAHHDLHHEHPSVPCRHLDELRDLSFARHAAARLG